MLEILKLKVRKKRVKHRFIQQKLKTKGEF